MKPRTLAAALLLFGTCRAPLLHAQAPEPSASTPRRTLAPLPEPPKLALRPPTTAESGELGRVLDQLVDASPPARDAALRELAELQPSLVAAIDARVNAIADAAKTADRNAMRRLLDDARRSGRDVERRAMRDSDEQGKIKTPDYLELMLAHAAPNSKPWRDLVQLLALGRALSRIGSVEAARELIDLYVRFGETLRVDVQLRLAEMGDRAVAALIEARRHRAGDKIAHFASRQLDALGRAIPSEAVQVGDQRALCDVLRAYGRVKDPDAARIVISFAQSERAQVRQAAREAVALMGDSAVWQLRDAYESSIGKKPPRDWAWERLARELFAELDATRLLDVDRLFERGLAAQRDGKLDEMAEAFTAVLTRSPNYEHKHELQEGFVLYAKDRMERDRPAALLALTRAERLADTPEARQRTQSLRLTLEAETWMAAGVADPALLHKALELDPNNERARTALGRAERGEPDAHAERRRWGAALAIAVTALIAMAVIALRRERPRRPPLTQPSTATHEAEGAVEPRPAESTEPETKAD